SEEEIRLLHSKLDHIIADDNPNLFESQRLTVEVMGEMVNQLTETRQQLELLKASQDETDKAVHEEKSKK
ncbi:MAG TPA: cyclic nucleotide-binding protein, partial [Lactobacillus sp.]|nr:cyclic nucleotide-binding protein [Lactobacillus sp.]